MQDDVHRFFDGEISRAELDARQLEEVEDVERALGILREDVARLGDADLAPAVMRRIEALPVPAPSRVEADEPNVLARTLHWLVRRREVSFSLRPAYVVGLLMLLLAGLRWSGTIVPGAAVDAPTAVVPADSAPTVFVRFEIEAPAARSVRLAGSFSSWEPTISLRRVGDGRWMAMVPLRPGVHDYAYQIDEERWMNDPAAPRIADGFGGFNSRLSLLLSGS